MFYTKFRDFHFVLLCPCTGAFGSVFKGKYSPPNSKDGQDPVIHVAVKTIKSKFSRWLFVVCLVCEKEKGKTFSILKESEIYFKCTFLHLLKLFVLKLQYTKYYNQCSNTEELGGA